MEIVQFKTKNKQQSYWEKIISLGIEHYFDPADVTYFKQLHDLRCNNTICDIVDKWVHQSETVYGMNGTTVWKL